MTDHIEEWVLSFFSPGRHVLRELFTERHLRCQVGEGRDRIPAHPDQQLVVPHRDERDLMARSDAAGCQYLNLCVFSSGCDAAPLRPEGEAPAQGRDPGNREGQAGERGDRERRQSERSLTDRTAGQTLLRKGLISREQLAVVQVDERLNRKSLLDSIVNRGWIERRVLENALGL